MKTKMTSKGVLSDIYSMRCFASQLLGKGKVYEPLLSKILDYGYITNKDLPLPSMKELQNKLGLSPNKLRTQLFQIYEDLYCHENNGIDFRINEVEYVFYFQHYDDGYSFIINYLPVVPRIGEEIKITYFKEKLGTDNFYVDSIEHELYGSKQTVILKIRSGSYNLYWKIRKDEAFLKREISWDDYYTADEYSLMKKLLTKH